MTAYCCQDEAEATAMTEMGTPLCFTCRRAYGMGQWHPTAEIVERWDSDRFDDDLERWCELCNNDTTAYAYGAFNRGRKRISLCAGCLGAFEMGQAASPDAEVYFIENVRFTTDEYGSHTVTAIFDGFAWQEVPHVADAIPA